VHFTKSRAPSTLLSGILLPEKRAKTVKFHNISSNGNASTASTRSTINHLSDNVNANTDAFSFSDLPNTARECMLALRFTLCPFMLGAKLPHYVQLVAYAWHSVTYYLQAANNI
jgi:hypothetical protein